MICPKCGSETEQGYGLAGGGIGVYEYCCECEEIVDKVQDEEGRATEGKEAKRDE